MRRRGDSKASTNHVLDVRVHSTNEKGDAQNPKPRAFPRKCLSVRTGTFNLYSAPFSEMVQGSGIAGDLPRQAAVVSHYECV